MKHFSKRTLLLIAGAIILLGAIGAVVYISTRPYVPTAEEQVRGVVYGFGDELSLVSLVGTSASTTESMDRRYSYYIRPDLLSSWKERPQTALGRQSVLPWPDHIDIRSLTDNKNGTYTVEATLVGTTQGIDPASLAKEVPVRFTVSQGPDGWQISAYEVVTAP